MNIIEQLEHEQVKKLTSARPIPEFAPGDTVRIELRRGQQILNVEATLKAR